MPALRIIMDGDGCWPDLANRGIEPTEDVEIACLLAGMVSGAPSVLIRVNETDGRVTVAQTSLALLLQAADAFKARYGDPRAGRP